MTEWVSGRVSAVRHWSDKLFSLRVEADLDPYQAGQFTRLALWLPAAEGGQERVAHAYSFVNPPGVGYHEFYIVLIPDGRLTPHLQRLQLGASVWLARQASGFLTLAELPAGRDLWMLSTGTAIGPFLSLLADGGLAERYAQLVLAHGVRLGQELNYRDEIAQLQARWPNRLHYVPFVTREAWPEGLAGRIPAAIEQGTLEQHVGMSFSVEHSRFVLCGNPQMVKETQLALQQRGFRKHLRREAGEICMENYW